MRRRKHSTPSLSRMDRTEVDKWRPKFKNESLTRFRKSNIYIIVLAVGLLVTLIATSFLFLAAFHDTFNPQFDKHIDLSIIPGYAYSYSYSNNKASPKKTCVITISAMNNFGFVWNLYDSTMKNSPGIDCFVWFVGDASEPQNDNDNDSDNGVADKGFKEIKEVVDGKDYFSMVTMKQMDHSLPNFNASKLAFMFNLVELQTTMKPFAFQYVFKEFGADAAIYLDNDIWVTDSLQGIQHHLAQRSAVVTPHYSSPLPEDGKKQKDKNVLASGVFNFGFVAFSNTPSAAKFLDWWGERLTLYGFAIIEREMFYDQNWGMFIPAFFDHEDYMVIRDLRYNVAYWNLHERGRGLHMKNGHLYLENSETKKDERVVFMHFSGMSLLEKYDMFRISRHQNRFNLLDFPRISQVFDAYMDLITKHNSLHYRMVPYGYDHFSDGTQIDPWMREMYAAAVYPIGNFSEWERDEDPPYSVNLSPYLRADFDDRVGSDPFCASKGCHSQTSTIILLDWLLDTNEDKAIDMQGEFYLSSIEMKTWKKRPDLRAVYPHPDGSDFTRYRDWFINNAVNDKVIDKDVFAKWQSKVQYHKRNHWKFHKQVKSEIDQKVGMNFIGWHAGLFSTGVSGTKIMNAARSANIPVNAIEIEMPIDHKFKAPSSLDFKLTRSISQPINFIVVNAADFWYALNDIPTCIWDYKYNIAYWAWELDTFREEWIALLAKVDEVWCPSAFIKKSIESSPTYDGTIVKVLPIPVGTKKSIDYKLNDEKKSELLHQILQDNKKNKPFVFMVAFDFLDIIERMNPQAAIKAFLDAFPAEMDDGNRYQLIVKSQFGTLSDIADMKRIANFDPRVIFLNELLSEVDMKILMEYQDCLVSLHRSEGYGMIISETLNNGIPVIATNYSGNVDFFTVLLKFDGTCTFPVPFNLIELEESYGPYEKGQHWADADHDFVVSSMRKVASNDCKKVYGKDISKQMDDTFGSAAIGKRMENMVSESLPFVLKKQKTQ